MHSYSRRRTSRTSRPLEPSLSAQPSGGATDAPSPRCFRVPQGYRRVCAFPASVVHTLWGLLVRRTRGHGSASAATPPGGSDCWRRRKKWRASFTHTVEGVDPFSLGPFPQQRSPPALSVRRLHHWLRLPRWSWPPTGVKVRQTQATQPRRRQACQVRGIGRRRLRQR